ncbi:response regulator transcription factor [Tsukamurella soli]|uniref:Response regulator transcription factor n=1 Tax=Tsukamurella soli TaxID=644556 RepID=A0ABP8K6B6_9ACTN
MLVVDDEPNIRELIAATLRRSGFQVCAVETGTDALSAAQSFLPHIIVLDVMLPDIDGFTVAARIRSSDDPIPVLFLTAKGRTADRVAGLTLGGDDYVTKPFDLDEVVARLQAILRRVRPDRRAAADLAYADVQLRAETGEVTRAGAPIPLSPTEFRLLRFLMSNAERALSREVILDHVWGRDYAGDRRIVETYIAYVRRKLDAEGPPLIHTLRTVGYVLRTAAPAGSE